MTLATAIATGDLTQLPSRRDEDWRWTDLRGLIRTLPPHSSHGGFKDDRPYPGGGPFGALAVDGRPPIAGPHVDEVVDIVNGYTRGPLQVGTDSSLVLRLRIISDAVGTAHASACDLHAMENSDFVLLESYEGLGADYVASLDLQIFVGRGARFTRIVIADDAATAVSVSTAQVEVMEGGAYSQTILTTGAKRQRFETHVSHPGAGASVRLDGVYLLRDQRHADLTTVVTHAGRDGTTSQLTKGVVRDQARGVFQGRIVVEKGADGTEARMGHHALILSDRAEVDAKPELLIFADDVQCAHGNTIGALDEAAIFYARQRGMPESVARAMLTEAFVGEVVDRIEHEGARDIARAWVSAQLGTAQ